MGDLVSKMDGANRAIDGAAPGLKRRFEDQGVSTANITSIIQISSWVRDQLPMLRRRQSLAQQMVAEGASMGLGGVWSFPDNGDNLGAFKTPEEARKAADDLANLVTNTNDPRAVPGEVYDTLMKYGNDPDFAAEFYSRIGPEGVDKLRVSAIDHNRDIRDPYDPRKAQAVGISLATASHVLHFDEEWLSRLTALDGNSAGTHKTASNYENVAPFLQFGNWDKDFLKRVAGHELTGAPNYDAHRAAQIWNGLSHNPVASAEFFNENFDKIQDKSRHDPLYRPDGPAESQQAWANMFRAATIDARDVYARLSLDDPQKFPRNLAEDNTARLINNVNGNKNEHVAGPLQAAYGDIIREYFPDLVYSVTSPVPEVGGKDNPNRGGIEVPEDAWASFSQEAMRDPQTAANMLAVFQTWLDDNSTDLAGKHQVTAPDRAQGDPFAWQVGANGQMRDFFQYNYNQVAKSLGDGQDNWQKGIDKGLEKAIDWAFDPKKLAKNVTKAAIQGLAKELFHTVSDGEMEKLKTNVLSPSASWQRWAIAHHAEHNIPPITIDGLTWTGDTKFYEELYGGGDASKARFTNDDGTIKSVSDMSPQALQAYNEWLQDPAVVAIVHHHFGTEEVLSGSAGQGGHN